MSGEPDDPYAPPAAEVSQSSSGGEVQRFAHRLAISYFALPALLLLLVALTAILPAGELTSLLVGSGLMLLWLLNAVLLIVSGAVLELLRGQRLRAALVAILGLVSGGSLTLVYLFLRRLSPEPGGEGAEKRTQGR